MTVAATVTSDLAFYVLLAGAIFIGALKAMERFGWLRSPTAWKTEAEALQRECDRLNIRIVVLEKDVTDLRAENAELRARPDMGALYTFMKSHDEREDQNHLAALEALTAITKTLEALAAKPKEARA